MCNDFRAHQLLLGGTGGVLGTQGQLFKSYVLQYMHHAPFQTWTILDFV